MRILILGASGRTGMLATAEALKQGHSVTALVRRASSMPAQPGLSVVEGTPLQQADVDAAFDAAPRDDPVRAVVMTLAVPRASDSPFAKPTAAPFLLRDSVRHALAAMGARGVRKLVVLSVAGAGSSWRAFPWLLKLMFTHTQMACVMEDHNAVDAEVRASGADGVEWTLVRSPRLTAGPAKPVRELGEMGVGSKVTDCASRESVAAFLIGAVGAPTWDQRAVVIAE